MERLRQLLSSINAQLSVLTVSQRLAIGLCAALIAGSLLWLLQWSTSPDLVPVIKQELAYEGIDAAEQALQAEGIRYETRGARIYVRSMDRSNAIRLLYKADALPEGSLFDMAAVVTEQNPFQSPEDRAFAQNYAKGNELAKIISTYPFVKRAAVIINPASKRRLRGGSVVPTASVAVTLTPAHEMSPAVVEGLAKLVSGAVAGLTPFNVAVTDSRTGRSYNVPHPDDPGGFDHLAIQKRHESHLLSKIMDKLGYVPGVVATVTVELDTSKRTQQKFTHDLPQPKLEASQSSEQSAADQPTEPGVQANLGTALTAGSRGQSNTAEETSVENYPPQLSETETIEYLPFTIKNVTATVSIPRSFVVGVYKAEFPDNAEPKDDDPEFIAVRDEQVARVRGSVEKIVMAKSPDDIDVDIYPDMDWSTDGGVWSRAPGGLATAQMVETPWDMVGLLRSYAPPVGLGLLALMSMFMMSRLVRKSSELAGAGERKVREMIESPEEEGILTVGPHTVGEAEVSGSVLAGREVDDQTLRVQELGDEVARMVQEDPQGSADLIRRWAEED